MGTNRPHKQTSLWCSRNKQKNLPRAQCAPMANRVNPNNFLRKCVRNVALQKSAVEISEAHSAILKKCAVDGFRSAHHYLRSTHWSFVLDGLSDKWEVCIDLSEVRTDRYQRNFDFWELHNDLWERQRHLRSVHWSSWSAHDVQEGRNDVEQVHTIKFRSAKWSS